MGRGKRISLDSADNFLAELEEVKPVARGYYASVSAFISENYDEFQAALSRGITHEQIADLMQSHDITVSPTTLRRYLPKKAIEQRDRSGQSEEVDGTSDLTTERLVCVAAAAMHVLGTDDWETFAALCKLLELEVEFSLDEDACVDEISFTRHGQVYSRQANEVFVTLGEQNIAWADIDPEDLPQSLWTYKKITGKSSRATPAGSAVG